MIHYLEDDPMTLPGSQNETPLGSWGVSIIRTYVPVAWGALVGWLLTLVPALAPLLNDPEVGQGATTVLIAASVFVWYFLARLIEPRLGPVLTRLIIGANAQPVYLGGPEGETQARITRSRPDGY
jgi:hypothetical protein